ncbi:hypothetical protein [Streptomyces koyangensis]|uniref:KfrA N-terminal DNA-binding domain-containing protein n=1 Tax=Streptomyces koyangensis TaxID=188770 RepID=A0ABX7ECF2_9ACTN|nr:hypothetical protein [Streptomyces koyangensis]QRF01869.1 hypothetical protein G9U55_06355 [Streptomyces koyangensis]
MSTASRPAPGPALEHLRYRLRRLWRESGEPSFRVISRRTGDAVGRTTVGTVLDCHGLPRWGPVELVVEALGGNLDQFRELWVAARDEAAPLDVPISLSMEKEPREATAVAGLSLADLQSAEEDLQDQAATSGRREGEARSELLTALEVRADLAEHLNELHERLGRERGRNEELRRRVAGLEAELAGHTDRIERLQDELREVRDERLILQEKLNGLHVRRAELYFAWAREEEARRRAAERARREREQDADALERRLVAAEELLKSVLASRPREDRDE